MRNLKGDKEIKSIVVGSNVCQFRLALDAVFFFIKLVTHGRDHGISVSDVLGNVLVGDLEKGAVGNTIHETKIMKDLKNESTKRLIGEETCNSPRLCVGSVADLRREADLWSVVDAMMEKVVVTD